MKPGDSSYFSTAIWRPGQGQSKNKAISGTGRMRDQDRALYCSRVKLYGGRASRAHFNLHPGFAVELLKKIYVRDTEAS